MATTRRKRRPRRNLSEIGQEALERALENKSEANYPVIVAGFVAKGLPEAEIKPRENVFTYHAWQARGRQVRRGEHGVKVHTVLDVDRTDPESGATIKVQKHRTATVFHVSQTDPLGTPQPAATPGAPPRPHNASPRPAGDSAPSPPPPGLPERFRAAAEGLTERIRHASRPLTQNHTPKRYAQYRSRLHDAANLRELQRALLTLADAHEQGACPPELAHLRSKSEIASMVSLQTEHVGNGYHPYLVTKPGEYHDDSPAARILQRMMAGHADEGDEDDDEATHRDEIERLETELRGQDIPGFFPTPPEVAKALVFLAEIGPGHEVLEPSAGIGSLAEAIREAHPEAELTCIEWRPSLCKILRLKCFETIEADFLKARGAVDRIVMNPPFEKGQDIDHVRHAYDLLKPGGRLVAIMSAGSFQRSCRKSREFSEWLVGLEGVERFVHLDNAFNTTDAFRRTGVRVAVIVLNK